MIDEETPAIIFGCCIALFPIYFLIVQISSKDEFSGKQFFTNKQLVPPLFSQINKEGIPVYFSTEKNTPTPVNAFTVNLANINYANCVNDIERHWYSKDSFTIKKNGEQFKTCFLNALEKTPIDNINLNTLNADKMIQNLNQGKAITNISYYDAIELYTKAYTGSFKALDANPYTTTDN